ncbi:MAG: DUF4149 domain-containing protein [Rhodospirillales bacterium]|nr:DUF4149 domain-containing protein [Rhodospirillales bacterium]
MELDFDWFNLHVGALVGTALVFGGMSFFAFVFTPMVFKFVEREDAAHFLRQVFPVYHRVIASLSCVPAILLIPGGRSYTPEVTALLAVALLNLVSARFIVPAADAAREAGDQKKFAAIHRLSVILHTGELVAMLVVLIRLAQ